MSTSLPEWKIPSDLKLLMESDEDLTWESDNWSPVELSVIGGTSHNGRSIDQSWQVEFEAEESDGYELLDRILIAVDEKDPGIRPDLHCEDTEEAAVVIWVESEDTCRRLMKILWPIVHES